MSKHMLGRLPLSAVQGLRDDLEVKLASDEGEIWLAEAGKFLRKETCWPKDEPVSKPLSSVKQILARDKWLQRWQNFYRKVFGFKSNELRRQFKGLAVPETREGFARLIIVLAKLERNQVFDACAERFPSWRWTDDLNTAIVHNDREPTKIYAIWIRDRVEADEENKGKSADDLKGQGHSGITLLERLLLELFYHWEIGKHLDIQNLTLCSGSRDADGGVPRVDWRPDDRELCVGWALPDDQRDSLRSRSAVSG